MRKHIFNAGPCKLPDQALENTSIAVKEFENAGQSIMELSHRSKDFQGVMDEAQQLFKDLLNVPENYEVLFLGGGASTQFAMIPFNFLKKKAAYVNTGTWSAKAIKEAKLFGEVDVIASSEDKDFAYYPKVELNGDYDYLHITTNNTIRGTEIFEDLDVNVPLIADMSSDMMSRKVDVSKYAMIYGGAQKNVGPAGVTFVIIRKDFMENIADRVIPSMMKYTTHADKGSMYNTPPCINIFVMKETLNWVKENGGVEEMERRAKERADLLYGEIDRNPMFKGTVIDKASRSRMNITFIFEEKYTALQDDFIKYAGEKNVVGIKGHRSVGGFRASTYNASNMEDVKALVACMQEFEKKHA